jgi:hypothetical protein
MVDQAYFSRQAAALRRLAANAKNPSVLAALERMAAHLEDVAADIVNWPDEYPSSDGDQRRES